MDRERNTRVSVSCCPHLCSTVFVVFLVLKLVGVIDWSWWWITAPLWISASLWLLFILLVIGIGVGVAASSERNR